MRAASSMKIAVGDQGRQQFHLPLGFQNSLVRPVQVIEMAYQRRDARRDIKRLQHVAADKIGQVSHRLHRHRLMKQFQRLIVFDAKATTEPGTVRRKTVKHLGTLPSHLST